MALRIKRKENKTKHFIARADTEADSDVNAGAGVKREGRGIE